MKKSICILLLCILALLCSSGCSAPDNQDSTDASKVFCWIREESGLVYYTISDDIIQVRYALCFENNSESDTSLSHLFASFKKSHLRGWMKYEIAYHGYLENGDDTLIVKSGEKTTVIYVFTGEYLGGDVNEKLYMTDFVCIQDFD